MLIQRTGTDRFAELGGLAKGRPVLATSVLIVGMLTLAVPGSANFAGEFAILAGVFTQGWGYAAVGAVAIVLAAMYSLRLISAVLHRAPGSAVREESLDLRFGELLLIVPLIAILLALSVWPASISEHTFPKDAADHVRSRWRRDPRRDHDTARRLARALACPGAARRGRDLPARCRPRSRTGRAASSRSSIAGAGFITSGVPRRRRLRPLPAADAADRRVDEPRPARRAHPGARRRLRAGGRARLVGRPAPRPRRRVLRAARRCGWRHGVLRLRREPDDAVPRARVVLDLALHPGRARHAPQGVARGGAEVPDRRKLRLGDPAVRVGADLRRHRRARLQRDSHGDGGGRLALRRRAWR